MTAQPDEAHGDGEQKSKAAGAVQREAWARGLVPPVEEVRPGLWSIPVPWPRGGIRYTLAYLLERRRGPALIDTGFPTRDGWTALADGIGQTGHDLADIRYVLVTHAHADHIGLVGRIREASGALVGMHEAEAAGPARGGGLAAADGGLAAGPRRFARGAGGDPRADDAGPRAGRAPGPAGLRPSSTASLPLGAGSALRAVWTPGHTPGHLCFYDERQEVLLTGDHVLPRITPHIGLAPGADRRPARRLPVLAAGADRVRAPRGTAGARVPVRRPRRAHRGAAAPSPDQAGGDRARRVEQSRPVDLGRRGRAALVPQLGGDHGHVAPGRGQRDLGSPLPSAGPRPGDRSRTRPRFLAAGPPLFRPGLTSPQWFDTAGFDIGLTRRMLEKFSHLSK